MAKPPLSADDINLWEKLKSSVTPLKRRHKPLPEAEIAVADAPEEDLTKPTSKKSKTPRKQQIIPPTPSKPPKPANLDGQGYGGISKADARAMKSGQIKCTQRLDLHGLSREQALHHLRVFVVDSAQSGHRCVLIITGKGKHGEGVIRANFSAWLNEPPLSKHVIAYCAAQSKDGGTGAWYVKLRQGS